MAELPPQNPETVEKRKSKVKIIAFVFGVLLFFVVISVPLTLVVLNTRQDIASQ